MKKQKMLNTNRGITLIALIITIIVMLILVAVTITIEDNRSLLGYARKATNETQEAIYKEQALISGEIKIGNSWYNSIDDYLNEVESVSSLQEKYEFEYYSSLYQAVTDVNNNTRDNAYANKENAVAGIYTDNGEVYVVLLKDSTEKTVVTPTVDMTINLGGRKLSTEDRFAINCISGKINIDGRLSGSTIEVKRTDGSQGRVIQIKSGKTIITGGTYILKLTTAKNTIENTCINVVKGASLDIIDAKVRVIENCGKPYGIIAKEESTVNVSGCDINVSSSDGMAIGIVNSGTVIVSDSVIKAYSDQSLGIYNKGEMTINNCHAMGTMSGLNSYGIVFVNGGTFEGFSFGGIAIDYDEAEAYIKNAIIRECEMPEGYTATYEHHKTGFYIDEGNSNIVVYMDNCDIYGSLQSILVNGTDNTLYISNSKINTDQKIKLGDGCKLYIGKGCNFTDTQTTNPSAVVITDDVYIQTN